MLQFHTIKDLILNMCPDTFSPFVTFKPWFPGILNDEATIWFFVENFLFSDQMQQKVKYYSIDSRQNGSFVPKRPVYCF